MTVNALCGLYEEELQRSHRREDWPQSVPVEMLPIGRFVAWLLQHYEVIPKTTPEYQVVEYRGPQIRFNSHEASATHAEANQESTSVPAVTPTPHDHD